MPIEIPKKHSPPYFFPEGDFSIVKYLDLSKFISLLQRHALFFCRIDKLEDKFEGLTSKANYEFRIKYYENLRDEKFFNKWPNDNDLIDLVSKTYHFENDLRSIFCVNCWNMYNGESIALWKIYSDVEKGIMIKSSISSLIESFKVSQNEIYLSKVKYIDYHTDIMPDGNIIFPFVHKNLPYSYENEIRLLHKVNDTGWKYDWSKEEVEEGIFVNIDLKILINEIVISPYSPNWFINLIKNLLEKYDFDIPITKSKLS